MIRAENLGVYRASPIRLKEDVSQEAQISNDYRGRLIYELLQNADDAMSDDGVPTEVPAGWQRLHVFLPTAERCPYPLLVNGAFAADLSRQEIRVGEFTKAEVAVVPADKAPGQRAKPARADEDEIEEVGDNFWLVRLRHHDWCPTTH